MLRLRTGIVTEQVTTLALERLQEVSVRRTLWQRLWGTGDLHAESAAESGGITMADIDDPQSVADRIVELSRTAKSGNP